MKKRLLSLLLTICIVISILPSAVFAYADKHETSAKVENPFADVNKSAWFYDAVMYSYTNGFFNGTTETTFAPSGTMTRGMFVTVLGRMAGVDTASYKNQTPFDDVRKDAYYAPYIAWAVKYGIASGVGEGLFAPESPITREQMATFFVRYFERFNIDYTTDANIYTTPADMATVSPWAQDAVAILWNRGLLNGDGTNFNPSNKATRAETATLAMRVDEIVSTWYKETGVKSSRVKINPDTGLPYEADKEEVNDNTPTTDIYYTVTYTDGVAYGTVFADQKYTVLADSDTPEFNGTPTRKGYTFAGWSPEVTPTVMGNVIYTAQWKIVSEDPFMPILVTYTVKYTDGVPDEKVFADQTTKVNNGFKTPEFKGSLDREGYTFVGWSPNVASTVTANAVYTAQWEINQYTITFANTGESVIRPITQDYKTPITRPTDPYLTGYTFVGWDKAIPATMPAVDLTINALWNINQYTIYFDTNGGSRIDPITQDYGTNISAPADPTKTGYIFAGWDADIPETMPSSNVTITAQWIPDTYEITFDTDGGTLDNGAAESMNVTYDTAYQLPTASKEGWRFVGWYLPDGITEITTGAVVKITEPTILTAKWEVGESYNIYYDLDGGFLDTPNPVSYNVITETFTLNNPTKEGYTFTGWSGTELVGENNMTVTVQQGETGPRSYTAHWSINRYTITFVTGNGATVIAPITADYGTAVTTPADPELRGHTFAGWDVAIPQTMPAEDITVTALWTPNKYTITFANTGDSIINPITQDYGTVVTPPADPYKTGYTFVGWDMEIPEVISDENITITAIWRINQYTITFITGEGATVIAPITADYGTRLTRPSDPTLKGFMFLGWDKQFPDTMPAEDLVLTAQWGDIMYAVSFYDGSRLIDTLYAKEDMPLGAVPDVTKSSKKDAILVGYFLDPEFTNPFYAENPVTEDIVVYAKYEEMGSTETLNFTSFAQMDQVPSLSFEIIGAGDPSEAVLLEVKDGSAPVELVIEPTANGYRVRAKNGFNPGCSYQLHLSDGWTFYGKPETVHTASFSIYMDEVYNLQMNDSVIYIKDTSAMDYTVNGEVYSVLTASLVTSAGGSFNYSGFALEEGDLICIYVGTHPEERNKYGDGSDTLDPAVYVKVADVYGTKITFSALSADEQLSLYNVPDNFPIRVDALPTGDYGTVNISALDTEVYVMMMGAGYTLATAKDSIEPGDFVSLYIYPEEIREESDIYFGEVIDYDAATGEIYFSKTSAKAIEDSMNLYSNIAIDGDDILTAEDKAEIEGYVLSQIESGNFAQDAAYTLANIIASTDDWSTRNFVISDANGIPLSNDKIKALGIGNGLVLCDDIDLTVELITDGNRLHFDGGTQLAIDVDAEFEVTADNGDFKVIQISATFVQEVSIDPKIKGKMVKKEVLGFIPVPIGVQLNATIDIGSFTAFSLDATVYTVDSADEDAWLYFKSIESSNASDLGINVPYYLSGGITTVKDITDKIAELEDMAAKAKDAGEPYQSYLSDVDALWYAIESSGGNIANTLRAAETNFGKSSITSDLLGLIEIAEESGLTSEYYDSLDALLDSYNELIDQESEWTQLFKEKILSLEASFYGVCIGIQTDFVVNADLSLAIGSNLEYQIGKRFEFWFKVGLFDPSSGSSTMDIVDEKFGLQFYTVGRLGLKSGISSTFYVGIGSGGDVASVGITAELGPYIKVYGFFLYEQAKYRHANTDNWISSERSDGAMYVELGMYFKLYFTAKALGIFNYTQTFIDEEIPLLRVGNTRYRYNIDSALHNGETVYIIDEDADSENGITMYLPTSTLGIRFIDLVQGIRGLEVQSPDDYIINLSNPNFTYDKNTGLVVVNVPDNVRYMKCDLTITYRREKQPFSYYDMTAVIPLVWTDMPDEEISEIYTATVRVGNDRDGYETVWVKRLHKGEQYSLPTEEEIFELMSWSDYKYELGYSYGGIQTEDLTLVEDKLYDFNIQYKTYSVTVTDVQNADGSVESRTYFAKYGEAFDFSDLKNTGTVDYENGVFTSFAGLNVADGTDIKRTVNAKLANALESGVTVSANYIDCGVTAFFIFVGMDAPGVVMKLKIGDTPNISGIIKTVTDAGLTVTDISPAVGRLSGYTTYYVACHKTVNANATITFIENGGPEVEDITLPWDSLIQLPEPNREGYTFGGWYSDEELTTLFTETKLPEGGATLYAKWIANSYTVTFNINGGVSLSGDKTITVTHGQPYGTLPVATRTNYGFMGWYTEASGGAQITEDTVCTLTSDAVLYARWRERENIPSSIFSFTTSTYTYSKGVTRTATYSYLPQSGAMYNIGDFTIKYVYQGNRSETSLNGVTKGGTYDVVITREADDYYNKFEQRYTGVIKINKASRSLSGISVSQYTSGLTYVALFRPSVDDLYSGASITYTVGGSSTTVSASESYARVFSLSYGSTYSSVGISITGDRNYKDASTTVYGTYTTKKPSSSKWTDSGNYDTSWYTGSSNTYTIYSERELAGLAYLVNKKGYTFSGVTIRVYRDLDMSAYTWDPIGTSSNPFKGTFDGWSETIYGLYFNNSSTANVGLIGYTTGTVMDVVVDDAYFYGKNNVGGVVGYISGGKVLNCTNYASIKADQLDKDSDYRSSTGGVVGYATNSSVMNCVNYGSVYAQGRLTGGVVGYAISGSLIVNNANFGSVTGSTRVGGVVGCSDGSSTKVYNNFSTGTVRPRSDGNAYIGGVVGRNYEDIGTVQYNYYLSGSAKGYDGKTRYIAGTETGSVSDGGKSKNMIYYGSSFTSPTSSMGSGAGAYSGMTLYNALTSWVDYDCSYYDVSGWDDSYGPDGYPLPSAAYKSSLR